MLKKHEKEFVKCCVKNCQKVLTKDKAIVIEGKYFCNECGIAYYRSFLKL